MTSYATRTIATILRISGSDAAWAEALRRWRENIEKGVFGVRFGRADDTLRELYTAPGMQVLQDIETGIEYVRESEGAPLVAIPPAGCTGPKSAPRAPEAPAYIRVRGTLAKRDGATFTEAELDELVAWCHGRGYTLTSAMSLRSD